MTEYQYAMTLHDFIVHMEDQHEERASMAKRESRRWYNNAYKYAEMLSLRYGVDIDKCIGIIAAFSIRQRWARNMYNAELFLRNWFGLADEMPRCFSICITKSEQIMQSDGTWNTILTILNGQKITRFARVIKNKAREKCVVIDSVMCRIFKYTKKGAPNKTEYSMMEHAVMLVADSLGRDYHELQAYAWILMRGKAY